MGGSITLQRVQHVSVARPRTADAATQARKFYGEILGLEEIRPPQSLASMDLIWFKLGDDELHVFPIDGSPVDVGQHFCIQVDDVDALRGRLDAAGVHIIDDTAIPNRPRFFCRDPFGNRIECTTILGPYLPA
jgi:catechol 2,3-dioxygenase-like lactoylglutathione lyase family enzyme